MTRVLLAFLLNQPFHNSGNKSGRRGVVPSSIGQRGKQIEQWTTPWSDLTKRIVSSRTVTHGVLADRDSDPVTFLISSRLPTRSACFSVREIIVKPVISDYAVPLPYISFRLDRVRHGRRFSARKTERAVSRA